MYQDPTNQDRANWAKLALVAFANATRMKNEAEETILGDLLCDFMHLCSEIGVDFGAALNSGRMHFEAEVEEVGEELPAWFHSLEGSEEDAMQRYVNLAAIKAAREVGYSVHLDKDKGTYAYCIDGDYSEEFESEDAAWDAAVTDHQRTSLVTFDDAIIQARELTDDGENVEYTRGVCELLARCFPIMYQPTDERAEKIRVMVLTQDRN